MDISQETLKNLDYLREFRRTNKVKQSKIAKGQAGLAIPVASSTIPMASSIIPEVSSIIPEITITGSTAGMLMSLPAALTAGSLIYSLITPPPGYKGSPYDTLPPTRQAIARAGESDATRVYSRGPVAIPRYLEEAPTQEGEAQAEGAVTVDEKSNEGSAAQTPTTPQGNPEEEKPENEPKEKGKIRKLVDKVLRRDGTTKDTPKDTPKETPTNKQGSFAGRALWETEGNNFGSSYKWRNAGRVPLYINYGPKAGGFIWDQMSFNPAKGFKKGVEFSQGLSGTDSISDSNKDKTTKGTNEVDSTSTISGSTTTPPQVGNYTVNFSDIQNMNRR